MKKKDYYEILGVDKGCNTEAIKKAYRQLALKHHPDRDTDGSDEKFKDINEAYETLSDSDKRDKYDKAQKQPVNPTSGGSTYKSSTGGYGFGEYGQEFQKAGFQSHRIIVKGTSLRVKVKITLQDIAKGTEKKIKISRLGHCPDCDGSGSEKDGGFTTCSLCKGSGHISNLYRMLIPCTDCGGSGRIPDKKCRVCNGNGVLKEDKTISVKIPSGIKNNMEMTFKGYGNAVRGGVAGDVIVVVEEVEDDNLKRNGVNLFYDLFVSITEAALGATVEVPTVDGKVNIKIEEGTQGGSILRLKGKGLPHFNNKHYRGDILVNICIWIPKKVSREERQLLESLGASFNFKPNPDRKSKTLFQRINDIFNKP